MQEVEQKIQRKIIGVVVKKFHEIFRMNVNKREQTREEKTRIAIDKNSCCPSEQVTSCCCSPQEDVKSSLNSEVSTIIQDIPTDKLKVDIYVPLEACSCVWSQFMNLVFSALTPYIKHIQHETKSLSSEEARKLNLRGNSIVVDGEKIYSSPYDFKQDLPVLLNGKGLL
ncbi:MAG: hypothetical protein JW891_16665 [Candidatus Lokiarchaeota archaeon]|nr:hypothetical protein [Candidatus Lokiarchaeota archaeon]